jgi:3-dehydroquinate synthetase
MLTTRMQDGHCVWEVRQSRPINYDVVETSDIFRPDNKALLVGEPGRRLVVVDEIVYSFYGKKIHEYFDAQKIEYRVLPVASTEHNKGLELFNEIARECDNFKLNRRSEPLIIIGGGVLTDVAGMVASVYRRGVPSIRVPTTLMGVVDAAIGIKTAINFNGNKNRVGSFETPYAVLLDRGFFSTLPMRHVLNGVGEIVKLALIRDAELFELLETQGKRAVADRFQHQSGLEICRRSINGMLEELEPNLFEDNLERVVDFGHTFSPLLEMIDIDGLLHGEAVAIDCAFSTILAQQRGWISQFLANRVINTMIDLGVPVYHPLLDADMLWNSLEERTTHRAGFQRVPLMTGIGKAAFANDITHAELARALAVWKERCGRHTSHPIADTPVHVVHTGDSHRSDARGMLG